MIEGKKIRLRAVTAKDLEVFRAWVNDWEMCQGLLRHSPVTDFGHKAWFKNVKKDKNQIYFAIEVKKTKKYVGNLGLRDVNWKDRNGDFFIYIGDKRFWRQGLGTEATRLFVEYSFNNLNLHKVCLRVVDFNIGAIKSYEKVGFEREGILREEVFIKGQYHDIIRMAIINKRDK